MTAPVGRDTSVCALVPHYACEQWLDQALTSLLEQTRQPEAIVVVDDGSPVPPTEIVAAYPDVTLLRAPDNGGPYRLVQTVMDQTAFGAYLFQDADDWSAPDRLEQLLAGAEATGAELIGSHEVRVMAVEGDVIPIAYPLDVNAVLADRPAAYPLLHPTSLVARNLVERLGGYASGMRFSGDAEFLRRAAHAARVVNVDHHAYFRRKRPGSLTTASDTALESPRRRAVQQVLAGRAKANAAAVAAGRAPDLRPLQVAPLPQLEHLCGPPLPTGPVRRRAVTGGRSRGRAARGPASPSMRPVFVIGAPRSGQALLAWALGQHRNLTTVVDPRWLANTAGDVERHVGDDSTPAPPRLRAAVGAALAEVAGGPAQRRPVAGSAGLTAAVHALAALLPQARFVHVVRDADEVVASLTESPSEEGVFYTGDGAWRAWVSGVEAGIAAEEALGAGVVLRVPYERLVAQPRETVDTCLDFLGEDFQEACVRPVLGLEVPAPEVRLTPHGADVVDAIAGLMRRLEEPVPPSGDATARQALARDFCSARITAPSVGLTLADRLRALVTDSTPEGARVVVVSKGDPRLVDLPEREGWHYPQVDSGTYAGFHPADSGHAVGHLRKLEERGAGYLVIPATGFWWLEFYAGMCDYLRDAATVVAFHADVGVVYRLSGPGPGTAWTVRPRALADLGTSTA